MTYYKKNTDLVIIKNSKIEGLKFYGHCQGFSRKGRTYEDVLNQLKRDAWSGWREFSTKGVLVGRGVYRKPTKEEFENRKAFHEEQERKAIASIIEIEGR